MADILIRGVEMPRSCMDCRLNYGEKRPEHGLTIVCKYSNGVVLPKVTGIVGRLPACGILELPEHGDLIERDALKHKFCAHCDGYEYDTGACADGDQDCMDAKIIMNAPAIVPANKEERE